MTPIVTAVSSSPTHSMTKPNQDSIRLVANHGVEGDVHAGATVKHRSRVKRDAGQPNLRQVHLVHSELHAELLAQGFDIAPGVMGENITTLGIDLLALPAGARLRLGKTAVVEVTGLRTPCAQLDGIAPGLMRACLPKGPDGEPVRKTGVMAVVVYGGEVKPGDPIVVELPAGPHRPLPPV